MHKLYPILSLLFLLLLTSCSSDSPEINSSHASGWNADKLEQCVPFARRRSGVRIFGNAYTWWDKAEPEKKLRAPMRGAVMVLSKTNRLSNGHLAVVKDVLDNRLINVTHTNWGYDYATRRIVYESMRVKDVSTTNDWSEAVFWNPHAKAFGSPYAVSGFIKK